MNDASVRIQLQALKQQAVAMAMTCDVILQSLEPEQPSMREQILTMGQHDDSGDIVIP